MRALLRIIFLLALLYAGACAAYFLAQESLIFQSEPLPENHVYSFGLGFEEHEIPVSESAALNALLFRAERAGGALLYLHGNAGNLQSWGGAAASFVALGQDVLIVDYRGYGKSDGAIENQAQLLADMQAVYDWLAARYPEKRISVLGHSLGAGPAAKLACDNRPARLILQASYYSLEDLAAELYPFLPAALLRYPLPTHEYLKDCAVPVVLVHGTADRIIPPGHARRLRQATGGRARLRLIEGAGHNSLIDHPEYRDFLHELFGARRQASDGG